MRNREQPSRIGSTLRHPYTGPVIPVMRPQLPTAEQVRPWLEAMDASHTFSNFGPLVRELENRHAKRLRVDPEQVVSIANATLGLMGAVAQSEATTWVVPAFTFPASAHAVLAAKKDLEFRDITPDTWLLDLADVAGGSGIMPVMPFGASIDLAPWGNYEHVVIDAAASLGASQIDLSDLPRGWVVVFSLHATKVLPAGEGGLAVFGDVDSARDFRAWTNFGFAGTRLSRMPAINAKMSETTAAYGLASLDNWSIESREWKTAHAQAQSINTEFGLRSPVGLTNGVHPYWIVQTDSSQERDQIEEQLRSTQIETRRWWPAPLPDMPAFDWWPTDMPHAKHAASTSVGLPMYRSLKTDDFDSIRRALQHLH